MFTELLVSRSAWLHLITKKFCLFRCKTSKNAYFSWFWVWREWGWQKRIKPLWNVKPGIAGLFTHQVKKFFIKNKLSYSQSIKSPIKSSKIPIFPSQTPYRTPYRSNLLTKPLSPILQPKNQTFISLKIHSQIQNYPYL